RGGALGEDFQPAGFGALDDQLMREELRAIIADQTGPDGGLPNATRLAAEIEAPEFVEVSLQPLILVLELFNARIEFGDILVGPADAVFNFGESLAELVNDGGFHS